MSAVVRVRLRDRYQVYRPDGRLAGPGDELELPTAEAEQLVDQGHAEKVDVERKRRAS